MDHAAAKPASPWRYVPNSLSTARIVAAPVLLWCVVQANEAAFTWVLLPAMLTDVADGWIARSRHVRSRLGSRLDSIADTLLLCAGIAGIVAFKREMLVEHAWWCTAALALWALECGVAFTRYGRLSSFHTYLSKAAGILLATYAAVLFIHGHEEWLFHVAIGVAMAASLEELMLLRRFPEWRADVRGLWWVARRDAWSSSGGAGVALEPFD
jgi:CDP-diacylglycerol--glycerol-3-phosphate 3-phosphatidyltransferase